MEKKRHHPLSIVWGMWKLARNSAAFVIYLFVVRYDTEAKWVTYGRWIFYAAMVIGVVSVIWKWYAERYETDRAAFHAYEGVFNRKKRTIPYTKIQNVHRHTSLFHRLFGVTSIRFETGTKGDEAAFYVPVLTLAEAGRLEQCVVGATSNATAADTTFMNSPTAGEDGQSNLAVNHAEENETAHFLKQTEQAKRAIHFESTRRDTVRASFTSLSFLVLIPILGSLYSGIQDFFPDETVTRSFLLTWLDQWWTAAILIVVLIIIAMLAGMVHTFIKYGNYRITSDDSRIYITKGMLEQSAFSIQKQRVQAVKITRSPMKRLLGLAEVELVTAGGVGEDEQEVNSLYPFLPVKQAYAIISEILPSYEVSEDMQRLPTKSLWLRLLAPSWIWPIATGALWYFKPVWLGQEGAWWMVSALLLVLIVTGRVVEFFHTRYVLNRNFIQLRTGAFTSTLFISKREKVIEARITQNGLQRWFGVASIQTVNRAKPVVHQAVKDVPSNMAEAFRLWYVERTRDVQTR